MYQTYNLSHHDAQRIIATIQSELEKDNKGAAVAIADAHGELVAFLRTDGCPLQSITIAINKAFSASRERKPSREIGESSRQKNFPMTNFGDPRFTGWGGGVPIRYEGKVIGAVAVSGLPEEEDMVLARLGADVIEKA
ncbi:MAG: heme-binding protein [Anaerolineae bacterium]|nr:heme-binding protein [Anaerolineae bacterium]